MAEQSSSKQWISLLEGRVHLRPKIQNSSLLEVILCTSITFVSASVLLAWCYPALMKVPRYWLAMKPNTALLFLLSVGGYWATRRSETRLFKMAGRAVAAVTALIAFTTFVEFFGFEMHGLDTVIAADPTAIVPGRMSIQACVGFGLLNVGTLFSSWPRRFCLVISDVCTTLLTTFVLSFLGSAVYTPEQRPGWTLFHQLAPHSLFCFCIFTILLLWRRTDPGGFLHIVRDSGIAGRTMRTGGATVITLPFAVACLRNVLISGSVKITNYAVAIVPAIMAVVAGLLVLSLAHRHRKLEVALRESSMTDELTGLHNRRGFYMLADHMLRQARRDATAFTVLFLDMDGLKKVNDTAGHAEGSRLLRRFATELKKTFRSTDVIARLGGDEFVIAAASNGRDLGRVISRLEANYPPGQNAGQLSFSFGLATAQDGAQTLDALLDEADRLMYLAKRQRKQVP